MHTQDRLLIAEALVNFGGSSDYTPRERRAWNLAADLLADEGLSMDALVTDVEDDWSGPDGQ